jgi:transporter family-2 protein
MKCGPGNIAERRAFPGGVTEERIMTLGWLIILLAVLGGAGMALQAPTNALLAHPLGSALSAALVSFIIGSAALAVLAGFAGGRIDSAGLRSLPWYAWLGGLYGAFFVAVAAYGAPRIGVGALFTAAVAGQVLMAVTLDQLGALGLAHHPASALRLAGVALVIGGAVLVQRG